VLASLSLIANPIRFSDTPLTRYDAPPMLGEHTEAALRELIGCTDEEIRALRKAKAI
jgi:crotonobetainyl-CoA:carnitine CoA-transferase CaiB-like acyl-CoA transferase